MPQLARPGLLSYATMIAKPSLGAKIRYGYIGVKVAQSKVLNTIRHYTSLNVRGLGKSLLPRKLLRVSPNRAFIGPMERPIGPLPAGSGNLTRMNKFWMAAHGVKLSALKGTQFIDEIKKTNWEPQKLTWMFAEMFPMAEYDIKGLFNMLAFLKSLFGYEVSMLETTLFLCTSIVTLADKFTFGASTVLLRQLAKSATTLTIYLTKKSLRVSWYVIAKTLKSLLYVLGKTPALMRAIANMAKKLRKIEKSPVKLIKTLEQTTTSSPNKDKKIVNEIVKAAGKVASVSPQLKPKTPSPRRSPKSVYYSAKSNFSPSTSSVQATAGSSMRRSP
jgi:hypothetical protein